MTLTTNRALPGATVHRRTRFFLGLAIAMLTLVVVGFARTFYLRPFFGAIDGPTRGATLPWHLVVHGSVMTAWFSLVVTQTLLIANRNVALHRRLGIAGAALAVPVIVVSMFTVVEFVVRREAAGIAIDERQHGVVVGDTLNMLLYFPLFFGAALCLRRFPAAHKRLMLLAGLVMFDPVVARYFTLFSLVGLPLYLLTAVSPVSLLLVLFGYDIATRKRPHWATVCGIVWASLSRGPFATWLYFTPPANAYVEWLRHLG